MIISLVVASASNNAIGKDNKMPWHLPNDMRHFKNITWGMPVIMGRKTFESLGKPLAGRKNIVVTQQPSWKAEGAIAVKNLDDAMFVAKQTDAKEIMVIGGGEIYKQFLLTMADKYNLLLADWWKSIVVDISNPYEIDKHFVYDE